MNLQIGMLWFDDTPQRPLDHKIELAVQHYRDKYGSDPNVCYVHPSVLRSDGPSASPLQIIAAEFILPHHFWIGVTESEAGQQKTAVLRLAVSPEKPH
jgi:hypothetical protein